MPELPAAMTAYLYTLTAVLGLCMGSFLNCFAYRYARRESVMKGRSKCALCGHTLAAKDLVPLFSRLFLRGRCRYCGGRISQRYALAEIICALAYVSVLARLGLTLTALKFLILASLLLAAAFSDVYCGLIPDRLTLIGTVSALVFALFPAGGAEFPVSLLLTLTNGLSVSLPLLLIVLIFDRVKKKESMGGGDIKLMFLIGLYFDWRLNILILITACAIGLASALIRRGQGGKTLPFAPPLSLAAWLVMLFGTEIVGWYAGLFH